MKLGYVTVSGRGEIDLLLAAVVGTLEADGWNLAGTVQTNIERTDRHHCDMDIRLLPHGPSVRISIDRGAEARGCRLDPDALERSVAWVSCNLEGADLLVINKFGKQEAEGRGLTCVIAEALDRELPVLIGVNGLNLQPFLAFSEGMAERLIPTSDAVIRWCRESRNRNAEDG